MPFVSVTTLHAAVNLILALDVVLGQIICPLNVHRCSRLLTTQDAHEAMALCTALRTRDLVREERLLHLASGCELSVHVFARLASPQVLALPLHHELRLQ